MMPTIDPTRFHDIRFRVRSLQYNTYEIVDHLEVTGQLRLMNVPTNILEIPPGTIRQPGGPTNPQGFMVGTQAIVAFTSSRERVPVRAPNTEQLHTATRVDITPFVGQSDEPWNEFILQGTPPVILRIRTILTRLDLIQGFTDPVGGPLLSISHDTTQSLRTVETGEAGLR